MSPFFIDIIKLSFIGLRHFIFRKSSRGVFIVSYLNDNEPYHAPVKLTPTDPPTLISGCNKNRVKYLYHVQFAAFSIQISL